MKKRSIIIRELGNQEYTPAWHAMQNFTAGRDNSTTDELWCLEHPPVFTMGLNGKKEHVLKTNEIPVIDIDRGGQVTYHGPGQLVIYTLLDLKRLGLSVKNLVSVIEKAVINQLSDYNIHAQGKDNAPGVYVNNKKIAALGLRIRKNRSYHGLALNFDMDLSPFKQINPCGYAGMEVTQVIDLHPGANKSQFKSELLQHLTQLLGYNDVLTDTDLPTGFNHE